MFGQHFFPESVKSLIIDGGDFAKAITKKIPRIERRYHFASRAVECGFFRGYRQGVARWTKVCRVYVRTQMEVSKQSTVHTDY